MRDAVISLTIDMLKQPFYWIIVVLGLLVFIFYKKIIGFMGEFWVKQELKKLPKDKYLILNDIMIETESITHQIDHIVLSKYGLFVIETKNYDGLILGTENQKSWTQSLGKNKYKFYNPIYQNYGHIKELTNLLNINEDSFISIICFSNRTKLNVKSRVDVVNLDYLVKRIKNYDEEILNENIYELKNKIINSNIKDKTKRKSHIKQIENRINNVENSVCPKCGGKLVEKNGKYGKFIGCSNYPNCNFTKNKERRNKYE